MEATRKMHGARSSVPRQGNQCVVENCFRKTEDAWIGSAPVLHDPPSRVDSVPSKKKGGHRASSQLRKTAGTGMVMDNKGACGQPVSRAEAGLGVVAGVYHAIHALDGASSSSGRAQSMRVQSDLKNIIFNGKKKGIFSIFLEGKKEFSGNSFFFKTNSREILEYPFGSRAGVQ